MRNTLDINKELFFLVNANTNAYLWEETNKARIERIKELIDLGAYADNRYPNEGKRMNYALLLLMTPITRNNVDPLTIQFFDYFVTQESLDAFCSNEFLTQFFSRGCNENCSKAIEEIAKVAKKKGLQLNIEDGIDIPYQYRKSFNKLIALNNPADALPPLNSQWNLKLAAALCLAGGGYLCAGALGYGALAGSSLAEGVANLASTAVSNLNMNSIIDHCVNSTPIEAIGLVISCGAVIMAYLHSRGGERNLAVG